jgi:hypothetical protein
MDILAPDKLKYHHQVFLSGLDNPVLIETLISFLPDFPLSEAVSGASNPDVVDMLLIYGARLGYGLHSEISDKDRDAIYDGDVAILRVLSKYYDLPSRYDLDFVVTCTPSIDVVKFFVEELEVDIKTDTDGVCAAIESGKYQVLEYLLEAGALARFYEDDWGGGCFYEPPRHPLKVALEKGDKRMISLIMEYTKMDPDFHLASFRKGDEVACIADRVLKAGRDVVKLFDDWGYKDNIQRELERQEERLKREKLGRQVERQEAPAHTPAHAPAKAPPSDKEMRKRNRKRENRRARARAKM